MNLNRRNIFLFDGLGAIASFVLTGLVLPSFSELLGLPASVLYGWAAFPFVYAIYSLSCYRFVREITSWMLLTVISGNLLYCVVSGVVISSIESITVAGRILLIAEILVVLGVVAIEWTVYKKAEFSR